MSTTPEDKLGSPTRRRFVLGCGILVLSAVGSSYLVLDKFQPTLKHWLRTVLQPQVPQLALTDVTVARLAEVVESRKWLGGNRARVGIRLALYSPWAIRFVPGVQTALENLERNVLTEYLLGSGFFVDGCHEAGTLDYRPTSAACANPFACFREDTGGVSAPLAQSPVCER